MATCALDSGGCESSCSTALRNASRSDWPACAANGASASITTAPIVLTLRPPPALLHEGYQAIGRPAIKLSGNQTFAWPIGRRPTRGGTYAGTTTGLSHGIPPCDSSCPLLTRGREMDEFDRQAARCVFVGIQGHAPSPAE